ncbi:MAG: T9SS type A sorting domain-containing protein [Flavobacteriales bacterium]|nr:T9SS type A sorting domain-containing protein [Flavobacteriales bacterium]
MISGNLDWSNTYPGPFDFTGFNSLDHIGGDLLVQNCQRLQSLSGLDELDRVSGDVFIASCDSIRNASGLGQLSVVGGDLQFFALTDFTPNGINQLDSVYGDCLLIQTDQSSVATAPNDLDYVGGRFYFGANNATNMTGGNSLARVKHFTLNSGGPALQHISGFSSLVQVDSNMTITGNDALTNLSGFNALDSIGGTLTIGNNEALSSITGFNSLSYVHLFLIWYNDVLSDISAFDHLINVPDHMQINNNPVLSVCNVQAVCDHLIANLSSGIYLNATGCESVPVVLAQCLPTGLPSTDDAISTIVAHPNPATENITLQLDHVTGTPSIALWNAMGQAVYAEQMPGSRGIRMDIGHLSPGVYSFVIKVAEQRHVVRFVKE